MTSTKWWYRKLQKLSPQGLIESIIHEANYLFEKYRNQLRGSCTPASTKSQSQLTILKLVEKFVVLYHHYWSSNYSTILYEEISNSHPLPGMGRRDWTKYPMFCFPQLTTIWDMGFSYVNFLTLRWFFFSLHCLFNFFLSWKVIILWNSFYWETHMIFILHSVTVYHIDWLLYVELSLYLRTKSHLAIVYDPFNVWLESAH